MNPVATILLADACHRITLRTVAQVYGGNPYKGAQHAVVASKSKVQNARAPSSPSRS